MIHRIYRLWWVLHHPQSGMRLSLRNWMARRFRHRFQWRSRWSCFIRVIQMGGRHCVFLDFFWNNMSLQLQLNIYIFTQFDFFRWIYFIWSTIKYVFNQQINEIIFDSSASRWFLTLSWFVYCQNMLLLVSVVTAWI